MFVRKHQYASLVYQFNIMLFGNCILSLFAVNTFANHIESVHLLARFADIVLIFVSQLFSCHYYY